jgi:hypothetical protein
MTPQKAMFRVIKPLLELHRLKQPQPRTRMSLYKIPLEVILGFQMRQPCQLAPSFIGHLPSFIGHLPLFIDHPPSFLIYLVS